MDDYEEHRGKGSFPAMITPAYQNAKKANELISDVSMKQEVSKIGQMQVVAYYNEKIQCYLFEQLTETCKGLLLTLIDFCGSSSDAI